MAEYKISLGVQLDTSDIISQINEAERKVDPIKIKVDAETKELTQSIQDALKTLSKGGQNTLTLDTSKFEGSIADVKKDVIELKNLFNNLDSNASMKSLVGSINQIATAIGKVENESDSLVKSLSALSKKDLSINLGFNMGKSASQKASEQGDIKRSAITQLKQQAQALESYLDQYYKVAQQGAGVAKLTQGTKFFSDYWEMSPNIGNTKNSLKQQVSTYKQYIELIQEAAKLQGVDISGVTSNFSKTTNEIDKEVRDVSNGVKEAEEQFTKLKNLLGSGLDTEGLGKMLQPLLDDVKEIRVAFESLSSVGTIDGLTVSFKELSEVLDKLVSNITMVKNALDSGFDGMGKTINGSSTEKAIQDQKELANVATQSANTVAQAEQKKRQAVEQTGDAIERVSKIKIGNTELDALNLKDDIDEVDKLAAALSKLKSIQSSIDNIEIGEIDISKGVQEIQTLERQLESLSSEYNETVAEINGMGGVSATQLQSFQNDIDSTNRKIEQLQSNLREKIQTAIGTNVARDVAKAHSECDKLSNKSDELRQKLQMLDDIQIDLEAEKEQGDVQKLSELYTRYLGILKEVNTQIDINKRAEQDAHRSDSFTLDKERAMHRLNSLFSENSEAARKFAADLDRIQREINECGDAKGLQRINKEITNLGNRVKETGAKTKTFGQDLKEQFSKYSAYFSVAELFMWAEQGLRDMFEQVKLIDAAMTELKKVTDETDASYNRFLTNAASRAKEIGTTIDGLVSSTADFARLGYGFEDAQGLAEVANIYAVVGDEIEGVEGATESLISTMAAFKDEMGDMSNTDFAMSIIDKFNEIGNNFAISSGGIGEALERSASSLATANGTLDESIALITAANTVVQNPEKVGKIAMPTIKMAISVKSWRQSRPRKDFISILIHIN